MVPYDKRSGKIWYNSELLDWADAKIHVLNHGLHYASCVFEGERVYDGSIFKLEEHTSRFFYSAKRMGFDIPYSEEQINIASNKIIATKNVENGHTHLVFWGPFGGQLLGKKPVVCRSKMSLTCGPLKVLILTPLGHSKNMNSDVIV